MAEKFKVIDNHSKKVICTGEWDKVCDYDKRLYSVIKVSDTPKTHKEVSELKVLEIIKKDGFSFVGRVAIMGLHSRYHNFKQKVLVNLDLTPYHYRHMKLDGIYPSM